MFYLGIVISYVFSIASFALFAYLAFTHGQVRIRSQTGQLETLGSAQPQGAISDTAQLIEALGKLTDSFAKAGPMAMGLVSAIFFLLVALFASSPLSR